MGFRKGDAALSESMMNVITLVLSFVLIVFVVRGIFMQSSESTYESAFIPIARDVAFLIDRISALAGSQEIYLKLPDGINVNVTVDNKLVTVVYDKGSVSQPFSGLIHSGPYFFENPREFCLVKNRDDRRVTIVAKKCSCKPGDGICDPECLLKYKCDSDCKTDKADNFCSKLCSVNGDGICDPDCNTNEADKVCDSDCIIPEVEDNICDPDCNGTNQSVCDLDCFKMYNGTGGFGGVCNKACKPTDANGDKVEDASDGICYTGCATKVGSIVRIPKDGICDLDCNETNGICDPDCNLDEDCLDKCAKIGENCSSIPCCQAEGPEVCCPGTKTCADAKDTTKPACCGNKACEVAPYIEKMVAGTSEADKLLPSFSEKESSLNWENYYTCPQDCQASNVGLNDPSFKSPDGTHIRASDLVCDNSLDQVCDVVDCAVRPGYGTGAWSDAGAKDNYIYCDPDCSKHPGCPYEDSRDQSKADGKCVSVKDTTCDPDCATNTTVCDPDCCAFNSKSQCASSPACYCPVRVNMSENFKKSPAFFDTNPANLQDRVYWTDNVIEVCSDSAIRYLNRRGWDIKQFEKELTYPTTNSPMGFAFDGSRYSTIRNSQGKCTPVEEGSFIQKASKTIETNEKYNLTVYYCCTDYCGRCGGVGYRGPMCDGVGFCGDHSVAILSILRTLGVPAYDVYAGFSSSANPQFRHAYVIYFCDPELPEYLKFAACKGNENKWLRVDATGHEIVPFEGTQWCQHFCIAYNDYGAFAQIDASKFGFGGAYNSTAGYAFPIRGMGGLTAKGYKNPGRELNCNPDPSCILNRDSPQGLCQFIGLEKCLT